MNHFPELYANVKNVEDFLQSRNFSLASAAGSDIPIETVTLKLSEKCNAVQVPFIVTNVLGMNEAISGYNVIQHLLETVLSSGAIELLRCTIPTTDRAQVNSLYRKLRNAEDGTLGMVKVGRRNVFVPKLSSVNVKEQTTSAVYKDYLHSI
jgi:hypothetical protein